MGVMDTTQSTAILGSSMTSFSMDIGRGLHNPSRHKLLDDDNHEQEETLIRKASLFDRFFEEDESTQISDEIGGRDGDALLVMPVGRHGRDSGGGGCGRNSVEVKGANAAQPVPGRQGQSGSDLGRDYHGGADPHISSSQIQWRREILEHLAAQLTTFGDDGRERELELGDEWKEAATADGKM